MCRYLVHSSTNLEHRHSATGTATDPTEIICLPDEYFADALQRFQRCLLSLSLSFRFSFSLGNLIGFLQSTRRGGPNHLAVVLGDVAHSRADWVQVDSLAWG